MVGWCVFLVGGGWLERENGRRAERELAGKGGVRGWYMDKNVMRG
jgi:hypothetical protein